MKINKKLMSTTLCGALILTIGISLSYGTTAQKPSKKEQLETLKSQEKEEKDKLERMPSNTLEEVEKQNEQGDKVKQLGIKVGKLDKEVNPIDPKAELKELIISYNNILDVKMSFNESNAMKAQDKSAWKKANEILGQKKQTLAQIEKDLKEGNKPIETLTEEFENLRKVEELNP
ncbi:hypothetical protein [Paenibacillus larvae]|uniref:Uncharacterized protein n=6 Tax=root TaxID=1 RepID=A0A0K2CYF2_9CAUD|nr:hypothetical protein [Paenibacillus larvae]YP_009197971.1 hypothetical protein AVV25_gp26 [Paenibacillus phage Diva]YP_009201937.1 hypothetical protein XENIA_27 [Paenibacillus phage Xenia]YP_009203471.1 hypothetical protein AVV23_gp26 [Paenibacillus phage Sitara]YP_009598549.1 hypothetical protein FDH26_gp26 [Paenibacillus phage Shelly]YP_009836571.1 hypothetical protein HWB47_gp27 [Paenibacillus phage Leyra]QVV19572.1 hypothetical protein Fitz_25 [Paenibacillus phage Fitz]QVV19637.1 hypo